MRTFSNTMTKRADLYYGGMWHVGATASWADRDITLGRIAQGWRSKPSWMERDVDDLLDEIAVGPRRRVLLDVLAALGMWHTATREQLSAMTGWEVGQRDMDVLVGSGLVQYGSLRDEVMLDAPLLYRPNGNIEPLYERMSWHDALSVTAGRKWSSGAAGDRHNVMTTELALRVAEHVPNMSLCVGPNLSAVAELNIPGMSARTRRVGDGVLVRADGFRWVLEMTSGRAPNLAKKVDAWRDVLTSDESRGVGVLFVNIDRPYGPDAAMVSNVKDAINRAVEAPGAQVRMVAERFAVANWKTWFPDAHESSSAFTMLTAERPTVRRAEVSPEQWNNTGRWTSANLAAPFIFTGIDSWNAPVLDAAPALWGLPASQRKVLVERASKKSTAAA